ncbi:MAG TPA: hypothetical protein VMV25_07850 [Steroidobacteraceae bacterium]|nr:hypothetical protein [Steroidobacteraceae bacterium]
MRALQFFSLPIPAGNVLESLNGSVNATWIGKFPGDSRPVDGDDGAGDERVGANDSAEANAGIAYNFLLGGTLTGIAYALNPRTLGPFLPAGGL